MNFQTELCLLLILVVAMVITKIVTALLRRAYRIAKADSKKLDTLLTKKKVVYLAHPIAGDPANNLAKILSIYNRISTTIPSVVPFVPYAATVLALDDDNPAARKIGISHNMDLFDKGMIDEVWVYGDKISAGVKQEIDKARSMNITVRNFTTLSDI